MYVFYSSYTLFFAVDYITALNFNYLISEGDEMFVYLWQSWQTSKIVMKPGTSPIYVQVGSEQSKPDNWPHILW